MSRTLFKYEPFRFEIQTPAPITNVAPSPNLFPYVTRVDPSAVIIQGANGYLGTPSSNESVVIDLSGGGRLTNPFVLYAGRFFDASANSFSNPFTFYKNETITPVLFDCCINLSRIQSTPSLPPGLSFERDTSSSFLLKGTPTVQIPSSNYLIIGTGVNEAQIVTTRLPGGTTSGVNIGVNPERIQVNISGTPTVSPMTVDIPIGQRVITSSVPSPSNAIVQYNWDTLPQGIRFSNKDGTPYFGNTATINGTTDASFTLVLNGTPTLETAKSFANANLSNFTYTIPIQAFRTSPLPILSNVSNALSFRFQPMVLFDDFTLPPSFYKDATVNPTQFSFRARTYFKTDASITSITQTGFPTGFSLNFVFNEQRAYLTGTPSVTGTFNAILSATDGVTTGSNPITINVANDSISFVPPTATSNVRFIVSRPLNLFKAGYYTSNIQFKGVAASQCNVTYTTSGLEGTGIETELSNGILTLTGGPSVPLAPTPLIVTATASATSTTASTIIQIEIVNDDISFNPIPTGSTTFLQNREITPIQFSGTTLSERFIQRYFSDNLPNGLTLSPTGLLFGAPLVSGNGTFTVNASTGLVNDSETYTYSVEPDNVIALLDPVGEFLYPNLPVSPVNVKAISKSGAPVTNIGVAQLDPSYGIVFTATGSNTGTFSGIFTSGNLATAPLSSNVVFQVTGTINQATGNTPLSIQTQNADIFRRFLVRNWNQPNGFFGNGQCYIYSQDEGDESAFTQRYYGFIAKVSGQTNQINYYVPTEVGITDFQVKYSNLSSYQQTSNTIICARNRNFVVRSTDGITFTDVGGDNGVFSTDDDFRRIYQLTYVDSNTWMGIGYRANEFSTAGTVRVYKSIDDGSTWTQQSEFADTIIRANWASAQLYAFYVGYIGSTCIRYKDGVFMIGGSRGLSAATNSLMRSADQGTTWNSVSSGQFNRETYTINLEGNVWLIGGSDLYIFERQTSVYTTDSSTIRYSTDQGLTWNNTNGDFNFACLDIVYGEGQWIAYGMSYLNGDYQLQFKYSIDGIQWYPLTSIPNPIAGRRRFTAVNVPYVDKIMFDGFSWVIYLLATAPLSPSQPYVRSFRHFRTGDLNTDWTEFVIPEMNKFKWKAFPNFGEHDIFGPPGGGYFVQRAGTKTSALTYLQGGASFYDPKV